MNKFLIVMIVMLSSLALFAQSGVLASPNRMEAAPRPGGMTATSTSQSQSFSFNFDSSPYNLPDTADIADPETGPFLEDQIWTKDFTRHINNPEGIILTLSFYNTPQHFSVTTDPENPLKLLFEPIPANWNGAEQLILVAKDEASGEFVLHAINITVTPVPDPPIWSGLPEGNLFITPEETELQINFMDFVECVDAEDPNDFDLSIADPGSPVTITQDPPETGALITFSPDLDFNGTASYVLTAVDRNSRASSEQTVYLEVQAVNDPPEITGWLPAELEQTLDQGASLSFSVTADDVDDEELTYIWTHSGTQNGLPFENVVSTTSSLEMVFNIPGTQTISCVVSDSEAGDSVVWTLIVRPSGPLFAPPGGTYTSGINVTLTAPAGLNDAVIHYTTDGSVPTEDSDIYTEPIPVNVMPDMENIVTIQAFFTHPDFLHSLITSQTYTITGTVAQPVFDPQPGVFPGPINLAMSTSTPTAEIYYSLDGSDPIPGGDTSFLYEGPVALANGIYQVRAQASKTGWEPSAVTAGEYVVGKLPAPVFDLEEGLYYNPIVVHLSVPDHPAASIHYTVDGSDPTETSPLYESATGIPIGLETSLSIRAVAIEAGWINSDISQHSYQVTGTVATPVFDPSGGSYSGSVTVAISTSTPFATTRYTLDGQNPSEEVGTIYTGPIVISTATILKAIAYREDWASSGIRTDYYTIIGNIANPVFTPGPGTYSSPIDVYISVSPPDATIYYTSDGSEPSASNGTQYVTDTPINVFSDVLLRARAFKTGWNPSGITDAQYHITGAVSAPEFAPLAGIYYEPIQVSITSQTPEAQIRYTIDGSQPSETNGDLYTGPVNISENTTFRAIAFKEGMTTSQVTSANYVIDIIVPVVAAPMFSHPTGIYYQPIEVTISTTTENAQIHYTTDGTLPSPTHGTLYETPILVPNDSNLFLQAMAFKEGWIPSPVVSANYNVTGTVADVSFMPEGGVFTQATAVVLTTETAGATIRYTADGSDPTANSSLYTVPIVVQLNSTVTIRAKGFKTGWQPSAITGETYIVTGQVNIPAPVFSLNAGIYTTPQNVAINNPVPADAAIHYTLDGSEPIDTSPVYTGPLDLPLNATITLKARAYKNDWIPSPVYSAIYVMTGQVTLPAVLFDPPAGTYQTAQSVTLHPPTLPTDAVLRYTLDGSEPSQYSPAYTNPIQLGLNSTTTIKVKGFRTDWIPSETASATYTITGQVAFQTPVFSPPPGVYTTAQMITVNGTTPADAVIRYTLDGTDPTELSTLYTGPINLPVESSLTLKVKAFKPNWTPSIVHTGTYTTTGAVTFTLPVFTPAPGPYTSPQSVAVNTVTIPTGATIYYTLDGSDPNQTSAVYTAPIQVGTGQSLTIRVRAYAADWQPSVIHTGVYNVTGQVSIGEPVFSPSPGTYQTPQTVVINTTTVPAGAQIRYTLDGSEPTQTSQIYSAPISVGNGQSVTIRARAYYLSWEPSVIHTGVYAVTGQVAIAEPVFTPAPGTYQTAQTLTINTTTVPAGAQIRYTTDGSEPTAGSTLYTTPISMGLNSNYQLRVRAFAAGWVDSPVYSGNYLITGTVVIPDPVFSPVPGTYQSALNVTLASAVTPTHATLRYTLDGSEPSALSAAYTSPIPLPMNSTTTLKVKGFADGWVPAATQTGVYTLTGTVAQPVFSPLGGTYGAPVLVSISTTTNEAEIRYTTDGSDPTQESQLYTEPVLVPHFTQDMVISARAFKAGWTTSALSSETYTILSNPVNVRGFAFLGYVRVIWNMPEASRALDGFNVYRRLLTETEYRKINTALVNTQVDGNYYYDDYDVEMEVSYEYYVTAVYDGTESPASGSTVEIYQTQDLEISDASYAWPNPATDQAEFVVILNRNKNVNLTVSIFDFAGKKVQTITSPTQDSNRIRLPWDLKNSAGVKVARGTYFARVVANDGENRSERVIKIAVK